MFLYIDMSTDKGYTLTGSYHSKERLNRGDKNAEY